MQAVFDTNILIYHLKGCLPEAGSQILRSSLGRGAVCSVITRLEVLGYDQPWPERLKAQALLQLFRERALDEAIADCTIQLRQQQRIKLPDAIVAATALTENLPLVTRNTKDFKAIAGLQLINPFQPN
ncbi:type II toxin-antitoxin system VapC family toxin [Synechococcus elongatus]|uniref:type II toxin-antitoxin system VapC family toxin n=1 Tax=Synechococcus elongatus TaxID=32046 RepID=UPI000F7E2BCD|nr:type II toxin-antitoxin system VapC family toxin [Synechococcus elongatus]